ncbi:hypothetical protein BJ508DRAFT_332723 [Ascobolus immersus RN42]|uniref:BAH domain-containing protein n=1 Tax=Ascobolus immersus RN42 TaxID=1160509 RepID=A0A3N4HRW5_ASCIM|nr:hypothetical protein BJ508DRAFT_332723 [Ascobolus immersus RN42]
MTNSRRLFATPQRNIPGALPGVRRGGVLRGTPTRTPRSAHSSRSVRNLFATNQQQYPPHSPTPFVTPSPSHVQDQRQSQPDQTLTAQDAHLEPEPEKVGNSNTAGVETLATPRHHERSSGTQVPTSSPQNGTQSSSSYPSTPTPNRLSEGLAHYNSQPARPVRSTNSAPIPATLTSHGSHFRSMGEDDEVETHDLGSLQAPDTEALEQQIRNTREEHRREAERRVQEEANAKRKVVNGGGLINEDIGVDYRTAAAREKARAEAEERRQNADADNLLYPERPINVSEEAGDPLAAKEMSKSRIGAYLWARTHNISKDAFQSLMKLRSHDWFDWDDIPHSYSKLMDMRHQLPTDTIYNHEVDIQVEEGDSSTQPTALCHFFKIEDICKRQLANAQVRNLCHEGLAKEEQSIVESYQATRGGLWPQSVLSSKSAYPLAAIAPPETPIHPGANVFIDLGFRKVPGRISSVFTNTRKWKVRSTGLGRGDNRRSAINNVWITFNPIIQSPDDVKFYGIKGSSAKLLGEIDLEKDPQLFLMDFCVPIDAVDGKADIVFHRHDRPDTNSEDDSESEAQQDQETEELPKLACCQELDREGSIHVWNMVVPENAIDRYALSNRFSETIGASPITTNTTNRTINRTERRRMALEKSRNHQWNSAPLSGIHPRFEKSISTKHLPQTLAEAELEAGEIEMTELLSVTPETKMQQIAAQEASIKAAREDRDRDKDKDKDPPNPNPPDPPDPNPSVNPGNTTTATTGTSGDIQNRPVLRIMTLCVDLYIDKFGVFRTTHRSAGAMYLTFHNMNHKGRDQLRNHFVVGFTPNGSNTQEAAAPVFRELKTLAKEGFVMELEGITTRVYVKLLTISADMAEAAELAGCRGASALYPCRFCELPRAKFTAKTLHITRAEQYVLLRQVHLTDDYRAEAAKLRSWTARENFLRTKGLKHDISVVESEGPSFNPFMQIALDISHSEQKGMGERLIIQLVDTFLSDAGIKEFARVLKSFKLPHGSSKIPNTAKRVKTLKMREVTLTVSMLPFILQRMDEKAKKIFKPSAIEKMNKKRNDQNSTIMESPDYSPDTTELLELLDPTSLKDLLIQVFLAVAKGNRSLFAREIASTSDFIDPYMELETLIVAGRDKIYELLAPIQEAAKKEVLAAMKLNEEEAEAYQEKLAREEEEAVRKQLLEDNITDEENDTDAADDESDTNNRQGNSTARGRHGRAGRTRGLARGRPRGRQIRGARGRGRGNGRATRKKPVKRKAPKNPTMIETLPNFHTALHQCWTARLNGTCLNVSTSMGEMQHRVFKQLVAHSNYYELDLLFCRYINIMMALRSIVDDAIIDKDGNRLPNHPWRDAVKEIRREVPSICSGYAFGNIVSFAEEDDEDTDLEDNTNSANSQSTSELPRAQGNIFHDVKLRSKLPKTTATSRGLPVDLRNRESNTDRTIRGIWRAYEQYGFPFGGVEFDGRHIEQKSNKLRWWESISMYDTENETRYTYRPGLVIPVIEKENRKRAGQGFAEIIGICSHNWQGKDHSFLYVRWLSATEMDPVFKLQRYKVQPWEDVHRTTTFGIDNNADWLNFISLESISPNKPPHFVKSIDNDNEYILNSTYFSSI